MIADQTRAADRDFAIVWARSLLARKDWLILDTETTGLGDDAQIVQLGLLNGHGRVLLDTLVRPTAPIPPDATAIHGITDSDVRDAPTFLQLHQVLQRWLRDRTVIIYNAAYDCRMLEQTCYLYTLPELEAKRWECAMRMYAQFYGAWNDYRGNYRWQPLKGGDHTAIGDCRATLDCLQGMAAATLAREQ